MPEAILMPALSAGMEEGTIARWLKAEGDTVEQGEIIAEVETDKAVMEFEAAQAGVLGKIVAREGATVGVNEPIAFLLAVGEQQESLIGISARAPPGPSPAVTSPAPDISKPVANGYHADRVKASPLARRIAARQGMAIAGLQGSGPNGRVVRIDVERAKTSSQTEAVATPVARAHTFTMEPAVHADEGPEGLPYRKVTHSQMRKTIARRLSDAKRTIPHFYLEAHCEIDALLDFRGALNEQANGRYKLSLNDFVIKAVALATQRVPEVNRSWTDEAMHVFDDVDIAIAVATDGGLITPVVRQADRKSLSALSTEISSLAARARAGALQPHEYQGGGITVSNLGMYGVSGFSAIINPPQSCILAVGAAERRPIVRGDACVPATVMTCTLSVDHRAIDGAVAATYLAEFKLLVEQPLQLLA